MALTDNATNGRSVKEAYGRGKLTLTADCEMGDLLTKAGALADGNSGTNKADWVAMQKAASGAEIEVCRMAVIGGLTGATLGDLTYLSDTAGGYSATTGTVTQVVGIALSATDILVHPNWSGNTPNTVEDDALFGIGSGQTARLSWDTTDANANALLLQMPASGAVDVPVIIIGQSIESVDLGLYNGVVDPRIALFGVGAVTTAPVIEFRKARGTFAAPTVVTTGDDLGTLDFYGAVAAGEYVRAASIRVDMAGTIATTRGPGTITFLTATDAAPSVLTQAMIISAAQVITMASTLLVQGASVTVGVNAATTGTIVLHGATSGPVTITAAAATTAYTLTLPTAANTNVGYQLTCAAGDTITSWGAAGSLRELKDIRGEHSAQDALDKLLNAKVYDFHYWPGKGTQDHTTQYVGVIADEAPWAMHYEGGVVNPVNTFGYSVLAIQALHAEIKFLRAEVAALRK